MKRLALVVTIVAGCDALLGKEPNPAFCAAHPGEAQCPDASHDAAPEPDTASGCTSDATCASPLPVCELSTATCVQCTSGEPLACTAATPVCGADDQCRGCASHGECASRACLPDGSCGSDANVAYVDPAGTDNAACTFALPCKKVAQALATRRAFVKLTATTAEQVTIADQDVSLLADAGARLEAATPGVILTITGASQVAIYDLAIANGLGSTGVGIAMPTGNTATLALHRAALANNAGGGLVASGGTVTIERTTISLNAGGGVALSSTAFDLENDMIVLNGAPGSLVGGIALQSVATTGNHRIEFSTIADNAGAATVHSGISCGTVTSPIAFANNIIYGNAVSGGGHQIGGSANCTTRYSDIGPDAAPGTGNLDADPAFASAAQHDYHLAATSPCKDAADPAATLDIDIDGDHRPRGPARDMGADEQ